MATIREIYMNIQWNLYKADTIDAWKKCTLYGNVRFIEIPPENKYLAKPLENVSIGEQDTD